MSRASNAASIMCWPATNRKARWTHWAVGRTSSSRAFQSACTARPVRAAAESCDYSGISTGSKRAEMRAFAPFIPFRSNRVAYFGASRPNIRRMKMIRVAQTPKPILRSSNPSTIIETTSLTSLGASGIVPMRPVGRCRRDRPRPDGSAQGYASIHAQNAKRPIPFEIGHS
jgi:hypothetical protein